MLFRLTAALATGATLLAATGCTADQDTESPAGDDTTNVSPAVVDALDAYEDAAETAWVQETNPANKIGAAQDALLEPQGPDDASQRVAFLPVGNDATITLCMSHDGYTEQRILTYTATGANQTTSTTATVETCDVDG